MADDELVLGKVVKLVPIKGFGFVVGADGTERFFHRSVVFGNRYALLREGQQVQFAADDANDKGPRCTQVVPVAEGSVTRVVEVDGNR